MKKIISLVAIMSMLLAIIPAYAEDVVIDVENMISAGAENWGETAEDIEITDGILSVKSSIVSYKKEKYSEIDSQKKFLLRLPILWQAEPAYWHMDLRR